MTDQMNVRIGCDSTSAPKYREDIDGLRAIAVVSVILFHLGMLPNGYLGVDVFFVISGFLITGIICRDQDQGTFSLSSFYIRRIRRILPLTIVTTFVALAMGVITMLPDDLENLAQSVVATNLSGNNILQAITTKNYWDVINDYKPLMHTWSLGVEEQYYMAYPILFTMLSSKRRRTLIAVVAILAIASLILCFLPFAHYQKFYYIPFRFWELAAGGLAALAIQSPLAGRGFRIASLTALIGLLCFSYSPASTTIALVATAILTLGVLCTESQSKGIAFSILENRLSIGIGRISFSLYMWHQVVLAFIRYLWTQEMGILPITVFAVITVALSIASYFTIEQPFRNRKLIGTRTLLATVATSLIATTVASLYLYQNAGVIRDVPELSISRGYIERGAHSKYNHRIESFDKEFADAQKIRVLVLGNSFARDWANVLMESSHAKSIEISYHPNVKALGSIAARIQKADVIFYSTPEERSLDAVELPIHKVWAVGTKNFGCNNGVFYNYRGEDRLSQRTTMERGYAEIEHDLKTRWKDRYISYIDKVMDDDQTVPVFTPSRQFISQDCRHLTRAGAKFFADLFEQELQAIFAKAVKAP